MSTVANPDFKQVGGPLSNSLREKKNLGASVWSEKIWGWGGGRCPLDPLLEGSAKETNLWILGDHPLDNCTKDVPNGGRGGGGADSPHTSLPWDPPLSNLLF